MARKGFRNRVSPRSLKSRLGMILGGFGVLVACAAIRYYWGGPAAHAQVGMAVPEPAAASSQGATPSAEPAQVERAAVAGTSSYVPPRKPVPEIVAMVNNRPITREELAQECLVHYGKEVLEAMVNKHLILQECRRLGVSVSRQEIDDEIERMAKRFNIPVDQWLKMLKQERGIKPDQYANEIIWPTLALRKLAGERLVISREDLMQAYEAEYGPAVRARLIACSTLEKAQKVQAMAATNPDDFGNLAKSYSEDAPSASVKGLIQPIRKHSGCPEVEQIAFALQDGGVSKVVATNGQFIILKRDGLLDARKIAFEQAAPRLEELLRDRKLRAVAAEVFEQLQKRAVVENVFNDSVKRQQMPGVAAMINGTQITLRQLGDECIERHGQEVLEGTINRRLIEMACRQRNITISQQEIDAEIARAALLMVRPLPDGSPDVKGWLALVTKKQGVPVEIYRRDSVWPSVALKKLVGDKVQVTEEDIHKGIEANYGPRVRCRAIVMNNLRRAQQVWEMARKNPTVENFGDLASKYSIEGSSRALQGEVPPIRRHGGQPVLEQEAFSLKAGELSGVIQIDDDKYIILFCEGRTKPVEVEPDKVRELVYDDLREKKQRLAMGEYFEQLQESATVDNFLAGTSRSPKTAAPAADKPAVQNAYRGVIQK